MNFLHTRESLSEGDIVVVDCSHQCNVCIMDDNNFRNYKAGRKWKGFGGFYKKLPAKIIVPSTGYWNIVLDLAGGSATIQHSISFIRNS